MDQRSLPRCLAAILLVLSTPLAAQPVSIYTEEWPPFNFSSEGRTTGYSTEIVRLLLAKLGRTDPITLVPSDRGMSLLLTGERTMMFSILRTPEREARFRWIGPLGEASIFFYQRKGSGLVIRTLDDAKRVRSIACRSAGLVVGLLREAGFTNLDASTTKSESVYLKLLAGRSDLAISDTPLGVAHLLRQLGYPPDALEMTPVKVVDAKIYLAASLDFSVREIAQWQSALDSLQQSGEIERLRRHYEGQVSS